MRIEEERQDVFQNIEFAVARIYRLNPAMTDRAIPNNKTPRGSPSRP